MGNRGPRLLAVRNLWARTAYDLDEISVYTNEIFPLNDL